MVIGLIYYLYHSSCINSMFYLNINRLNGN